MVEDANCGCRGCSSGDQGERNIFGNKYGQYLAGIQVRRERKQAKAAAAVAGVWAEGGGEEEDEEEGDEEAEGKEEGEEEGHGKRSGHDERTEGGPEMHIHKKVKA